MPTSPYAHIPTFVSYLVETRPRSLLDIGLGNGKLGYIARDLLDVMLGERYRRDEWQVRIDGIEVFPDYLQGHQEIIYDNIYIGDALSVLPGLGLYDTIILGDVLEHFPKDQAWTVLDLCFEHLEKHLILNLPMGEAWQQPEIYNNPHEKHRSFWHWDELKPFVWKYKLFEMHPGTYSTLLIRKEDYVAYRYDRFMQVARAAAGGGLPD